MTDSEIQSFRHALGVSRPIRVAVRNSRRGTPQTAEITGPYGIIGRGTGCHITLKHRLVAFRHVYLQAFGDRVMCIDLLSPNAIVWNGPESAGWLTSHHEIQVGPYSLQLLDDGWDSEQGDWPSPLECKTRTDDTTPFGALPLVSLELLNPQFKGMAWPINRVLTLVGRDDRCRITCADERISRVHCSLLLNTYGLWAIDLLGRGGIRVNGVRRNCAHLRNGDQLSVGDYQMSASYESSPKPLTTPDAVQPETDEISIPEELLAEEALPSAEFLTRNNKIFPVAIASPVMIVEPRGGIRTSGYQQIQLESNIVMHLLQTRSSVQHLVVDIHYADAMDSIIISSIMAMCRAAKGKAVICNASESMLAVLNEMNLTKVWPHFATRDEALQYVNAA